MASLENCVYTGFLSIYFLRSTPNLSLARSQSYGLPSHVSLSLYYAGVSFKSRLQRHDGRGFCHLNFIVFFTLDCCLRHLSYLLYMYIYQTILSTSATANVDMTVLQHKYNEVRTN